MNIPKVNISFRKLKADVVSSSEEDGLLTFHYTICPDASAEDSFPERFQLSSSSLPYILPSYDIPGSRDHRHLDGRFRFFKKSPGRLGSRATNQSESFCSCGLLLQWK